MKMFERVIRAITNSGERYPEAKLNELIRRIEANTSFEEAQAMRGRIATAISGGYDFADTLHNVYLDYGYPASLQFSHFWNMYRRFGIAKNIIELPVDIGWSDTPEIEAADAFKKDLDALAKRVDLWDRLRGLDTRQRVGRYAGLFMRVRDGQTPDKPINGKLAGAGALVQIVPLYESQLEVLETDEDATSETFGLPTMYQYNGNATGSRNEKATSKVFNIHPSRIIIAAEGADTGDIYGIPALEAAYNSLMDLRKIIGAGGEGFYKNAAQSVLFKLTDAASAKQNAALLDKFNEAYDDFAQNRMRRAMWTPGLDPKVLESSLANPAEFFNNALNDVAAAAKIPATILIGKQTGRLASDEDSRQLLSMLNSRRKLFQSEVVRDTLNWMMKWGVLPTSEYEIEWSDLLARSDEEKLGNAETMSKINHAMFASGQGVPFTPDEVRESAGFEAMEEPPEPSEELPDDEGA